MSVCISVSVCVCASMMASSLLRSTSDFLASGVDKCLNQLYDYTNLQSPVCMSVCEYVCISECLCVCVSACISVCVCVCASMMASSLLRSTSDFLASGVDKCLDQLYDCTDLQSPDSSCSSTSDNSRLSYNTRAAFERRYLAR